MSSERPFPTGMSARRRALPELGVVVVIIVTAGSGSSCGGATEVHPPPASLAAYRARSERRNSSDSSSRRSHTAIPDEKLSLAGVDSRSRSIAVSDPVRVEFVSSATNSSPPSRATTSPARRVARMRSAVSRRARSPCS